MAVALEPSWLNVLGNELEKTYMKELKSFLLEENKGSLKPV